jgi:hypothetical protein
MKLCADAMLTSADDRVSPASVVARQTAAMNV